MRHLQLTLVLLLLFTSSFVYAKDKMILLKPKDNTTDPNLKEESGYFYENLVNMLVANYSDDFDVVFIDKVITDDDKAHNIGVKHEAVSVLYGSYRYTAKGIQLNLKISMIKTEGVLNEFNETITDKEDAIREIDQWVSENDPMIADVIHIGVKGGYPMNFGNLAGKGVEAKLPYGAVVLRYQGLRKFTEWEVGFFYVKAPITIENAGVYDLPTTDEYTFFFPVTVSIGYNLELFNGFNVSPKIGVGFMLGYTPVSTYINGRENSAFFSSYLIAKPGLEISYELFNNFAILVGADLITAMSFQSVEGLDFYFIPNAGMRLYF